MSERRRCGGLAHRWGWVSGGAGQTGVMQHRMQRRSGTRRWSTRSIVVVVGLAVVGCSGGGDVSDEATATTALEGTSPSASGPTSVGDASDGSTTTSAVVVPSPTEPTETIETVPEEGLPGIDSADPFCQAWSEFAGSFQALTFASVAGSDPVAAVRLEVVAAAAVAAAVQSMDESFPDAISGERVVFVDEVVGPFGRRASRATEELRAAGLVPEDIDALGDAWLLALVEAGVDDPDIVVVVPDGLAAAVDEATATFAANVPAIVADPSLVTEARTDATFDYLAQRCPDQGILGGIDAVD